MLKAGIHRKDRNLLWGFIKNTDYKEFEPVLWTYLKSLLDLLGVMLSAWLGFVKGSFILCHFTARTEICV